MNAEMRAVKCQRADFGVYRAPELKKLATAYEFPQEHHSTRSGGRLSCGFDSSSEPCAWYSVSLVPKGLFREGGGGGHFQRARFESFFELEKFDCTSDRSFPFDEYFLMLGSGGTQVGEARMPMESLPDEVGAALEVRVPCQMDRSVLKFE